jgi:hypothetical protein
LQSVEGELLVRFPAELQTLHLDGLTVGRSAQAGDVKVTVTSRVRHGVTLTVNQDADRVVYIRLLDDHGQALTLGGPPVIIPEPGGGAQFQLANAPARAEIVIAREVETVTLPFSLALP